jgi:hypothetical protein
MREPLEKYPSPLVRLYLLERFSQTAQLPSAQEIFTHLGVDLSKSPLADAVAQIAQQVLTINGTQRTLPECLKSSPAMMEQEGRVQQWSQQLLGTGEVIPQNDPTAARDAAVAVARAHFLATKKESDLDALRVRATSLVRACYAAGVRAGTRPTAPEKSLADSLFHLGDEELLASATSKNSKLV